MSSSRRSKRKFSKASAPPTPEVETPVPPQVPLSPPIPRFPEAVGVAIVLVVALLLLGAYFSNRGGDVDEVGLFNPAYMDLHYGKISYPIYGYFNEMVVHPPVHYKIVAAFMRRGLTYYYAEATPTLLLLLAGVLLIAVSGFPAPVKIGLLCGLVGPIAAFAKEDLELFGMRPEAHINAAWLAGLIALESGRLRNWDLKRMFIGAFLLTYASGLHYYAAPALLGVLVYMIWALAQLGWRRASKPLLGMAAGGLLFGVPYLLLFLIPEWRPVMEMLRSVPQEGMWQILRNHIDQYRYWATQHDGVFGLGLWFWLGVPVVLVSTPILIALPSTRALALAALPLEVFVLLFAGHKHAYYFIHEVSIYCAAVVAGGTILAERLVATLARQIPRRAVLTTAASIVTMILLAAKWNAGHSTISLEPREQEAEVARAAGKAMLGLNARVGSRLAPWYTSGADQWVNISSDLLWRALPPEFDVAQYVARFDAVAETSHMSNSTQNGRNATLSSWYLDGILHLAGFFFAESNMEASYLLLRGTPSPPVRGYALRHGGLVRFEEDTAGDHELVTLTCPAALRWDYRFHVPYSSALYLPRLHPNDADRVVITALVPPDGPPPYTTLHPECQVVQRIQSFLTPVDRRALVEKMRREDRPMRFYRQPNHMPGVGPVATAETPILTSR
ncbi:MAG TPA: hypothetical protein VGV35_08775 [Bryobacteraceae bacterium]|nr:hypothetical protein [Bryobacteraceae bacterium]